MFQFLIEEVRLVVEGRSKKQQAAGQSAMAAKHQSTGRTWNPSKTDRFDSSYGSQAKDKAHGGSEASGFAAGRKRVSRNVMKMNDAFNKTTPKSRASHIAKRKAKEGARMERDADRKEVAYNRGKMDAEAHKASGRRRR
jgi:hypothetical protein